MGSMLLQLVIEVNLVAAEPLQLVRIQGLSKRLLADQRPVGQFLAAVN
jgi:hypothetical protein